MVRNGYPDIARRPLVLAGQLLVDSRSSGPCLVLWLRLPLVARRRRTGPGPATADTVADTPSRRARPTMTTATATGDGHGTGHASPVGPAAPVDGHPLRGHPAVDRPVPPGGAPLLAPALPQGLGLLGAGLRRPLPDLESGRGGAGDPAHLPGRLHPLHHPAVGRCSPSRAASTWAAPAAARPWST